MPDSAVPELVEEAPTERLPRVTVQPVFVDATGRRMRRLRRTGALVGVACVGYLVVLAVAVGGGVVDPVTSGLPLSDAVAPLVRDPAPTTTTTSRATTRSAATTTRATAARSTAAVAVPVASAPTTTAATVPTTPAPTTTSAPTTTTSAPATTSASATEDTGTQTPEISAEDTADGAPAEGGAS